MKLLFSEHESKFHKYAIRIPIQYEQLKTEISELSIINITQLTLCRRNLLLPFTRTKSNIRKKRARSQANLPKRKRLKRLMLRREKVQFMKALSKWSSLPKTVKLLKWRRMSMKETIQNLKNYDDTVIIDNLSLLSQIICIK